VISQIDRKGPHAELRYRLTRWIEVGGSSVKLRTSAAESNQYNGNTSFSLPGNFQLSLARSESRLKLENNAALSGQSNAAGFRNPDEFISTLAHARPHRRHPTELDGEKQHARSGNR